MPEIQGGIRLHSDGSGIFRYPVKDGVTLKYGFSCKLENVSGQARVALPSGDGDAEAIFVCLESDDALGDADGTVEVDIACGQPSVPMISQAAIAGGKQVAPKGTDGRIFQSATGSCGIALNTVDAADKRVWVTQGK